MPLFTGSKFGFGKDAAGGGPPGLPYEYWEFKVWGAGGGGGSTGPGGGGAYITGQYQISPNTDITFVVGSRSVYPVGLDDANYGGGGPKGTTHGYSCGTGGGMSGVFLTSDPVFTSADSPTPAGLIDNRGSAAPNVQPGATVTNCLIAAGAGGACSGNPSGWGGHGGITAGGNSAGTNPATGGSWDGAGTDTGAGGIPDPSSGTESGGLFFGGKTSGGGGGGGGFYGGGGGGNSSGVSGGAGGSSYYKTTTPGPPAFLGYNPGSHSASEDGTSGGGVPAGTAGQTGNVNDPLNVGVYGSGTINAEGQDGFIAYRRAESYAALPAETWTPLTHTGTDQVVNTGPGIT